MATPVLVVLVIVAMTSLVAVAAVVLQLVGRVQRLRRDLQEIERDVLPRMARLQEGTAVTGQEVERVSRSVDALADRRSRRAVPRGRSQER